MIIKIYGHSDDLVEVEGHENLEFRGNTRLILGGEHDPGGVKIDMSYVKPGVWAAKIKQLGEGLSIPWPVEVRHMACGPANCLAGYSVVVCVDIGNEDVRIKAKSLEG